MSQWLQSSKTHKLFLYSAWVVVCVGIFMIFMLTPWFSEIESQPRAALFLRILLSPLAILAAPASLILWFGMTAFCVFVDRSSVGVKIWWFVIFFATAFFGAAVYFFKVYRKQVNGTTTVPVSP